MANYILNWRNGLVLFNATGAFTLDGWARAWCVGWLILVAFHWAALLRQEELSRG